MSARDNVAANPSDTCEVALLLIDVINDFEYPGGEALFKNALPAAHRIAALKRNAQQHHIPVVYVNDNFGKWRAERSQLVRHCVDDGVRGEPIVRLLAPEESDYFVLKPRHSSFYQTPLDLLLTYLKARALILAGFAGDICVLLTAADAFLRDYRLFIPGDCSASQDNAENEHFLRYAARVLEADTTPSPDLNLGDLLTHTSQIHR
jgi:nicotinamidase-related amidase